MPIDPAVLDELERLEKAATPGPLYLEAYNESGPVKVTNGVRWQRAREDGGGVKLKVEVCRISEQYMERSKRIANGELIVAMWNALPDLIAALRESQANDRPDLYCVLHKGSPLVIIECDTVLPDGTLYQWYADKYAFDRNDISIWKLDTVFYRKADEQAALDKLDAATEAEQ